MDPFLEDPSEWSSVHAWLITSMTDILADVVSPDFFVRIEQRVYITSLDTPDKRAIVPDAYVVATPRSAATMSTPAGGIAERPDASPQPIRRPPRSSVGSAKTVLSGKRNFDRVLR